MKEIIVDKIRCGYCKKSGYKTTRHLRAHERMVHKVYKRKGKNGAPKPRKARVPGLVREPAARETIVQESICYCPFCGKQLPNATIIRN